MENKYIIKLDKDNNILSIAYTFDFTDSDIEITREEYEQAKSYRKFNPVTRCFTQPIHAQSANKTTTEIVAEIAANTELNIDTGLILTDLLIEIGLKLDTVLMTLGIDPSTVKAKVEGDE